jgi:hypothetical protein
MKKVWDILMVWAEAMAEYRRHSRQYRSYY